MSKKELVPLKVGDKVNIYDASSFNWRVRGTVLSVAGASVDVKTDTAGNWSGFIKQVRRLRPKKKEEKRERVEDFKKALQQIASGGGPVDATTYRTWERTDMMNYARKTLNRWEEYT